MRINRFLVIYLGFSAGIYLLFALVKRVPALDPLYFLIPLLGPTACLSALRSMWGLYLVGSMIIVLLGINYMKKRNAAALVAGIIVWVMFGIFVFAIYIGI